MSDDVAAAPLAPKTPTLSELFIAFVIIALSGFGGTLAWSRRMIVEQRRWMTSDEFNEAYALCQFLPGPNIVNFSVVFGSRFRGPAGAAVAFLGLLGPPVVIVTIIAVLYSYFGELPALQRMLIGVSAAAAGLIAATAAKMAEPLFHERNIVWPAVALVTFVAIGVLRWPLPWVLAVLVPSSVALAWWRQR